MTELLAEMDSMVVFFRNESRSEAIVLFALVLIIGIALSVYLYSGPNPSYDDVTYAALAREVIMGKAGFALSKFAFGLLGIFQISAFFYVFGYGGLQGVASSFVDYVIMVFLIFLCGKELGGKRGNWFGATAAYIGATFPFISPYVFRILLDIPLGMVAALSVYLFLKMLKNTHNRVFPVLFGLATASLIYIKTEGYLLILASFLSLVMVYFLEKHVRRFRIGNKTRTKNVVTPERLLFFAIGVAAIIISESVVYYFLEQSPLFVFKNYINIPNYYSVWHDIVVMFSPYTVSKAALMNEQSSPGIFFDLAIVGGVVAVLRRNSKMVYLFMVVAISILYFIFGPNSVAFLLSPGSGADSSYNTILFVFRYLAIIAPFLSLLCAYLLFEILDAMKGLTTPRAGRYMTLVIFLILATAQVPIYLGLHILNSVIYEEGLSYQKVVALAVGLSGNGPITFYISSGTGVTNNEDFTMFSALQFYSKYNDTYRFKVIGALVWPSTDNFSSICKSPPKNSFLVNNYILGLAQTQNRAIITKWLGSNCTATYLGNFTVASVYDIMQVYRISQNGT